MFRLACKHGFVHTARVLYQDLLKQPEKDQSSLLNINEKNGFILRLALVHNQSKSISFLLREVEVKPQVLSKKLWYSLLPYYLGAERSFTELYPKSKKEDRLVMKKAFMEYCLRARLVEKWMNYWFGRKKKPKKNINGIIFNILQISGY